MIDHTCEIHIQVFFTARCRRIGDLSCTVSCTCRSSTPCTIGTCYIVFCVLYNIGGPVTFLPNIFILDPPPAPAVNPITVVDEGSTSRTVLISWSQSSCAVQYVITIINSSDDRVYPNITTSSNTNTTVTLPTGVEFCVTLVAVDSIGRKGPDTTPVCYCKSCEYQRLYLLNQ